MLENATWAFGRDFVAYTLGLDSPDLPEALSPIQAEVASQLDSLGEYFRSLDSYQVHQFVDLLFQDSDQNPLSSSIREFRLQCRGEQESPIETGDEFVDGLYQICRDIFALTLIDSSHRDEQGHPWPGHFFEYSAFRHNTFFRLCMALLRDSELKKLFPPGTEPHDTTSTAAIFNIQSDAMWSNGSGGTHQLAGTVSSLVQSVLDELGFRHAGSFDQLLRATQDTVHCARHLASGQLTQVRTIFAISNIDVKEHVDLGTFKLRPATKPDRRLLHSDWQDFSVLEIPTDLRMLGAEPWPPPNDANEVAHSRFSTFDKVYSAFHKEQTRRFDQARFSLLLARPAERMIAPIHLSSTVTNPLTSAGTMTIGRNANFSGPFPRQTITREDEGALKHWAGRVVQQPESLDMGMRRLVSAATNRPDPMDGFIDSIIAWENLFGTSEGESTFRVCGAMANVIHADHPTLREPLMRELQSLYSARSRLVHGGQELDETDADSHRRRAIELAVTTFRAVHERPEILRIQKSALRGRMAVLGF